MVSLLVASVAAFAESPPEGVDLDALEEWEAMALSFREGPQGCWVFEGTTSIKIALFTPPSLWTRPERHNFQFGGKFEGRFENGAWVSFRHDTKRLDSTKVGLSELDLELDNLDRIVPLFGTFDRNIVEYEGPKKPEDDKEEDDDNKSSTSTDEELRATDTATRSLSAVDELLNNLSPSSFVSFAQWSSKPRGVRLVQDAPLDDRPRSDVVTLTTFFPDGTGPATEANVVFPKRMTVRDGMISAKIMEPQMRLRGKVVGNEALPLAEAFSGVVGFLGFTVGYEQALAYNRATPCPPTPTTEGSP